MTQTQEEANTAFFARSRVEWEKMGGHPSTKALGLPSARVGDMLVTREAPDYDVEPSEVLMNLTQLDGAQILKDHAERHSRFGTTPFDPAGDRFRMYPGGVTIWSGFPGAGKTTLLRQLICHLLRKGSSVFLASLEEDPQDVLVRIAATAAGADLPNVHQMQWFIDAYSSRFRLWGMIGLAQHRKLLAVARKLADEFSVRHVVIDSLMCMDIANDDFEAQRKFANLVAATARAANIHIHLVAHPRKLISSDQEPDINDVAGARELGGVADNIVFVRRSNEKDDPASSVTPMKILIKKQRHGNGILGDMAGWYHRNYRQFHVDQFPTQPTHYLPEDAYT